MHRKLVARGAVLSVFLSLSPAFADEEEEKKPPTGLYLQPHIHALTGWKITVDDPAMQQDTQVELRNGGGVGLRLGYDFSRYVGLFASVEANAESEGPYFGYGAGLTLRTGKFGPLRLNARLGARVLEPVTPIVYGTAGVGAELFLFRTVSLGAEVDAALPLAEATRDNGLTRENVSADGGPVRGIIALTWYIGG
ncbi:hypothetical protein [Hyalangium rubrum]|uniref:Outer membrane protein beta-barrel domain-containing protein n=1 Tax=Hyalangium rubrum TaxID=3103134 RepID=A0ABU5H7S6_9BACT|nr:hypothetical protein [Hyalangium sp. s54d21]MDY7228913.1 hypothetical protein [Hyalangium sp. s54d21]